MSSSMEVLEGQIFAYQSFLKNFLSNVNPEDQLPVRIHYSNITRVEVLGAVIDWILQYLNSWKCPQTLISPFTKVIVDEIKPTLNPKTCPYYNEQHEEYSALPLMRYVISVIRSVCQTYLDSDKINSLSVSNAYYYYSTCAARNRRRSMEDSHVVIHDLQKLFNLKDCGIVNYYAVFDGHNGVGAALYSAMHLHQYLVESPFYPMYPEQALCEAFKATDKHLLEKDDEPLTRSGTTAVCVLWHKTDHMLYVAWAGDSEALLAKRGKVFTLVEPHKAEREDERKRIQEAGGVVLFWGMTYRVNGQLAVSRAIGDQEHKSCIIPNPDVRSLQLHGDEDFLIIACDGLWDSVKPEEAANAVYNHISKSPDEYDEASQILVQLAKSNRSEDNITVIVVYLSDPHQIKLSNADMETATAESFSTKQNGSSYCTLNNLQGNFDPEDDFGPETNIDNIDDGLSQPVSTKKTFTNFETLNNGLLAGTQNNSEIGKKTAEIDTVDNKNVLSDESDEDEWNYFKGEGNGTEAKTNNHKNSQSLESNSADASQEMDHKLNPDAAEFVPVSPTSVKSVNLDDSDSSITFNEFTPNIQGKLLNDEFIASSPMKGQEKSMENVDVPTLNDFDTEIRKRPSNILPSTDLDDPEISVWNDGDVCAIKKEELGLSPVPSTIGNDTAVSTKAVFGDESRNIHDVSHLTDEPTKEITSSAEQSFEFQNKFLSNGVFDNEDYPSIIEKEVPATSAPFDFDVNKFESDSTTATVDTQELNFGDISNKNDPIDNVIKNFVDFAVAPEATPTHSTVFVDNEPVFRANSRSKTPSPVEELMDEIASKKYENPFVVTFNEKECAEGKEVDVSETKDSTFKADEIDFLNRLDAKADTVPQDVSFDVDDTKVEKYSPFATKDEFVINTSHFGDVENEPSCTREIKTETEAVKIPELSQNYDQLLSLEKEPEPSHQNYDSSLIEEKIPEPSHKNYDSTLAPEKETEPSQNYEQMLASQILDANDLTKVEHDLQETHITSNNLSENSKEESPFTQYDAVTPYIHDCTRMDERHDSVHPDPTVVKRYADLLPDLETTSTMESDKLESELRGSESKDSVESKSKEPSAAADMSLITEPKIADESISTTVPSAPELSKTLEPAVDAVIAEAKKEIKKSVIKKPTEEKAKVPAKTTSKPSTTAPKSRPTTASRITADAKKTNLVSSTTTKTGPAKPSVTAARPAPKPSTVGRTSVPSKTTTTAKPLVGSTTSSRTTGAGAPKVSSPAKSRPLAPSATTVKTNGDVSSAKPMTARKITPVTSAPLKKSPTESSPSTKPSINLATRTSLAPRPKPAAPAGLSSPEKAKLSTLASTKRPTSAPPKPISKDSNNLTNKRSLTTRSSPLKTSTGMKTESKNGLKKTPMTNNSPKAVKKPLSMTATTVPVVDQSPISSEHQN